MKITLPTSDQTVAVGKLLCIGRNYADHAAEMKRDVPDEPMVFLKPATAVVRSGGTVRLPPQSENVHHEVELVAAIGKEGRDVDPGDALDHVAGYAVGLDMTARDLQDEAKARRHPWSVAKGFDTFAPLGALAAPDAVGDPQALTLRLRRTGDVRQEASTADMIFPVAELISFCSRIFTLEPGDLLYTGTPSGVGPVEDGDTLEAEVTGCEPLTVSVAS